MTGNNNKLRGVLLSALMVMSVFAGTIAFAGGAAAAYSSSVSLDSQAAGDKTDFNYNITTDTTAKKLQNIDLDFGNAAGVSNIGAGDLQVVVYNDSESTVTRLNDSSSPNGINSVTSTSGEINITLSSAVNVSNADKVQVYSTSDEFNNPSNEGDYTANIYLGTDSSHGDIDSASNSYAIGSTSSGAPTFRKATHYVSADSSTGATIELAFSQTIDTNSSAYAIVYLDDGTKLNYTASGSAFSLGSKQVNINTSSNVYNNVKNVTVHGFKNSEGTAPATTTKSVTFASTTLDVSNSIDNSAYVGSNVALEAGGTETSLKIKGPSTDVTRGTGAGSQVYVLNTDGFSTGDYNVSIGSSAAATLSLSDLGLGITADDTSINTNDNVTGTVSSGDINRDVTVEAVNADDEVVASTTVTVDADGQVSFDLGTVAADNYTLVATDINTAVTAESDTITVTEAAAGQISFSDSASFSVAQGGIAEIPIEFSGPASTATVVIGNEDDSGYQANLTVTDSSEDGKVVIQFNTYTAGDTNPVTVKNSDDDISFTSQTPLSDLLDSSPSYNLYAAKSGASVSDTLQSPDTVGSLSIQDRSTNGVQTWTAPSTTDFSESTVTSLVASGSLTQDSSIVTGDYVVHQIDATGLGGLVKAQGNLQTAFTNENLTVSVKQTNPKANSNPKALNVSASTGNITFISDADNDTYYVAFQPNKVTWERTPSGGSASVASGDNFNVTVTVADDRLLAGSDNQSVMTEFGTISGSVSYAQSPTNVTATSNVSISGSSTYAPEIGRASCRERV